MSFQFGKTSEERLKGVHPDLIRVMRRAISISPVDFGITSGVRTSEEQMALFVRGKTPAQRSAHMPHTDGMGHAVDIHCYKYGLVNWEDLGLYRKAQQAIFTAAITEGVHITSGALFGSYFDGPHVQLNSRDYEATIV